MFSQNKVVRFVRNIEIDRAVTATARVEQNKKRIYFFHQEIF